MMKQLFISFCSEDKYYIRQNYMGQQDSKPQISSKQSPRIANYQSTSSRKQLSSNVRTNMRFECDGLLKLKTTPFKNCIEIQTENQILFLENVQITLKQLLQGRLHTNKLFLIDDIEKLIETLTFTLAQLQQHGITYSDVSSENIYYDCGNFKLLPNQLININSYQKLRQDGEVNPSPQLIIALRCGEQDIQDDEIIEKSNVFTLGMLLLEVSTLLPSSQCYDSENYDILDSVINQRIIMVEQYYGERIAKIIANMLDYDYTERMNLKNLSIWVNRQLQNSKVTENMQQTIPSMSNNSIINSKVDRKSQSKITSNNNALFSQDKSRVKQAKNNSVYMGFNRDMETKEDRNKIYINEGIRHQEQTNKLFNNQAIKNQKKRQLEFENHHQHLQQQHFDRMHYANQSFNDMDSFKLNQSLNKPSKQSSHPYQYNEDYKAYNNKQDSYETNLIDRETVTRRIAKQQAKPFRNQNQQNSRQNRLYIEQKSIQSQKANLPLKQVGNQYYPHIDDILKNKSSNNGQNKGSIGENGSLNRIKQEILKSRKLIEEFKRNEGLKF